MRIAFDAKRLFNNNTGLGNYARTLISKIQELNFTNKLYLFTTKQNLNFNITSNTTIVKPNPFVQKVLGNIWRVFFQSFICKKHQINLYHGLSNELPLFLKTANIKSIVTIHDLIFLRYPGYYNFIDNIIYRLKSKYACKNANHIVAISHQTKQDIINFFNIKEQKITVLPLGCDDIFKKEIKINEIDNIKKIYSLNQNFFLSVGTVEPRKNQLRLVQAFEKTNLNNMQLIIVGSCKSAFANKVKDYVEKNKLNVRFLQVSSSNDLACIYQLCTAFVYISEFEGFGIPLLEAMECKAPVIASNISSIPEVCGNAAFYVNPYNVDEIANALCKIYNDKNLRTQLIEKGSAQAKLFDYNDIARKYLELYEKVLYE